MICALPSVPFTTYISRGKHEKPHGGIAPQMNVLCFHRNCRKAVFHIWTSEGQAESCCASLRLFFAFAFLKRLSQTVFHFSRVYAINIGTHPQNDASGEYVPIETTFASIGVCPCGRAKAKRRDVCAPLRCFKKRSKLKESPDCRISIFRLLIVHLKPLVYQSIYMVVYFFRHSIPRG